MADKAKPKTLTERWIDSLKDHPVVATVLIVSAVIVGVGAVTDSFSKIADFFTSDGGPPTISTDASVQEFHIIRGATDSPKLINSLTGNIDELETYQHRLSEELIKSINPKPEIDVDLAIDGVLLSATRGVTIFAQNLFGIQGPGNPFKIAEVEPDSPLDCDQLFAGRYGDQLVRRTLFIRTPDGRFENSQVIISKDDDGYSLKIATPGEPDTVEKKTRISLKGRPLKIVVDTFVAAGEPSGRAKELAATLEAHVRKEIDDHELLLLSPLSVDEMYRVHDEVKMINPDNPGKGRVLAEYGVDYVVRCTVKLSSSENGR
jgi:hypothetical protein